MKTELYQKEEAKQFYENRYEKGYMDEWPIDKKQRVLEIINVLNLPENGVALDFGCGNGVFTDVINKINLFFLCATNKIINYIHRNFTYMERY